MKKDEKALQNDNNCKLSVKKEGYFYNLCIDLGDIKDVRVRLVSPNRKLAYKLFKAVNK